MRNVVFVAPFFAEATIKFIDAAASLPNTRVALISQDSPKKLPHALQAKLHANYQVQDGLSAQQIADATRWLGAHMGGVDRLIATLEHIQVQVGEVRDLLGIEGMGADTMNNFRDKARMKDVLRAAGLPCAKSKLLTAPQQALDFARDVGFPFVLKPPAGAGAVSTFRVTNAADLEDILGRLAISEGTPVLAEEFVQGQESSLEMVSIKGEPVWHSGTSYHPTPLEVLENPWIQWVILMPRELDDPCDAEVVELGKKALAALGMHTGISHMEWFRRADGSIAISEIAARPPGAQLLTATSAAHDLDMFQAWAELMVFDRFASPERNYAAGVVFLRGQGHGDRVKSIRGVGWANARLKDMVVEAKLPQYGQPRRATYEGDGYVILRHPETQEVKAALRDVLESLRVQLG